MKLPRNGHILTPFTTRPGVKAAIDYIMGSDKGALRWRRPLRLSMMTRTF